MSAQEIKCVVVGDGAVGKTCLLTVHVNGKFPSDYIPTVFDTYRAICKVGDRECSFTLCDTAGQEGYENLRKVIYPGTSVFLVCFSVDNQASFENIRTKWVPDIKEKILTAPIILVGCKTDIRSSEPNCISQSHGQSLANEIHAVKYMECSAKMNTGVKELFESAIMVGAGINNSKNTKKKHRCIVM